MLNAKDYPQEKWSFVPSSVIHEKNFALWAKALKGCPQSSHEYVPVIHAVYRLEGAINIDKHYKTGEGNEEQISVVGRLIRAFAKY